MQAIKVSFTQNGAYLMEGQNEVNSEAVRRPAIPTLVQNLLCTVGVILGLAWFLFGEYRAGKDMKQATLVAVASLLFGILLVLLFKKIGLLKKLTAIPIPVIETDLSRFEGYHRSKSTRLNSSHGGISRMPSSA